MIKVTNSDGVMTWLAVSAVAAVRESAGTERNLAYVRLLDGTEYPSYDRSAARIAQEIELEVNK